MKKTITLFFAILLEIITINAQAYQWAKGMGGTSDERGISISLDGSGNVYTTGTFSGTVDFDPGAGISNLTSAGEEDIFISKLDAAGNFLWAKSMGGIDFDYVYSIAVDGSGNVYTTGNFRDTVDFDPGAGISNLTSAGGVGNDIFISKLDAAGNFLWAKSMGGIFGDGGLSIVVDSSDNVYTTGWFTGTVDFNPGAGISNLTSAGGGDIFISKLDIAGNFLWAKSMGGTNGDLGISIAIDGVGNIYTTGFFEGTADFDPGAGTSYLTSAGLRDIFISKLDATGNFLWAKSMGGTSDERGNSITVDGSGNVHITGWFEEAFDFDPGAGISNLTSAGKVDIFISKLDAAGNFLWAKSMGGTDFDYASSIAVDGSGNVYITGNFRDTVDFDPGAGISNLTSAGEGDIFISKLDAAGNFLWAKSIGGIFGDGGFSIVVDSSGYVFTTGAFSGTVDFNPGAGISNLTSAGGGDVFISKLDVTIVGILENSFEKMITVYPNPTNGGFSIDLKKSYNDVTVIIRNQLGQNVFKKSYSGSNLLQHNILGEAGMYFIEVSSGNKKAILKVVKE